MTFLDQVKVYHAARYPYLFVQTHEETRVCSEVASLVAKQPKPGDIAKMYQWDCLSGMIDVIAGAQVAPPADPATCIQWLTKVAVTDGLIVFKDIHLHLDQNQKAVLIRALRNAIPHLITNRNLVLFTSASWKIPVELERYVQTYVYKLPTSEELYARITRIITSTNAHRKEPIVIAEDVKRAIADAAKGMIGFEADNAFCKAFVETQKFNKDMVQSIFAEKISVVQKSGFLHHLTPDIGFDDIGGMNGLKKWISLRKKSFTSDARDFGLPYSKGIILAGIQGCGKTMLAKAVSREFGFPLFQWDIAGCFHRYVGDSEGNVRQSMETVDALDKCVLLIDELEGVFNTGAAEGKGDTGTSSRVFSMVLTWLSERTSPAFIIGTSNNFMAFPPQFVRPGRWDQAFWIDLPTVKERVDIYKIILKRYKQDSKEFDLQRLAETSREFTGAEIDAVVLAGMYRAYDGTKKLCTEDILEQVRLTKPQAVIHAAHIDTMRKHVADKLKTANDDGEVTLVEALLQDIDKE